MTSSTTIDKPLLSLEDMTGFVVFEEREGYRLSDYWQQRTKSQICRVHVTPRKTLFRPSSRAPVDLALLAPCMETHKSYLNGSTLTLCDTWLGNSKGEWVGETRFIQNLEGCASAPAQSLYAQGETCASSVDLDLSQPLPALQAEENVVCNFDCSVAYFDHCRHIVSRSAVLGREVYLPSPHACALDQLILIRDMPGAPTRSCLDNQTKHIPPAPLQ